MERDQETIPTWGNEQHDPAIGAMVAQSDTHSTDITERKRLEDELRDSEWRFRTMFEQAAIGIAFTALDGQLLEVNRRFCDIVGYTREELLKRTFRDITHPDDLAANDAYLYRVLAGGPPTPSLEKRYIHKDGKVVWVYLTVSLMCDSLNRPRSYMSLIEDITARKHAEEERAQLLAREREARRQAEAATKRLEALLAVTDTALAHLALNDLLRELLNRIHQVMAVDNVAILLTTDDNQYLTLRAAFGPEEEVAGQVRVPIGKGFAGTIASTAKPRVIEDLSTVEVMTSILREKLTSLLGVPLLSVNPTDPSAENRVIGVIHIGTMSSRRFTEEDVQLLQRVAERVTLAIMQSRLYEAEQRARNEAIARANEQERLERQTRNSLNSLLAMAQALVLVPDDAGLTERIQEAASPTAEMTSALAHRLAELICDVLGCTRAAITVLDPLTKTPRAIAAVGISSEQEQKWRSREPGSVLAHMFTDPASTVHLEAGEVLTIDMTQPPFRDYPNPYGIRTMLLAPMSVGNTLVGFLAVDDGGAEHSYTAEEITMTSAVAKLAALVIERARLLSERAEAHANVLALQQANSRMDAFLGIASHELRTPLTTIKANIQMAQRQLKNLETPVGADLSRPSPIHRPGMVGDIADRRAIIQELLERADQQSRVLNRLIGDLLNVSRIQTHTLEIHIRPTPCNLLTIVQQAIEDQRKVTPKRDILLQSVTQQHVPVLADPDRIAQVIMNFLANALKYSSADQPAEVSLEIVRADALRSGTKDDASEEATILSAAEDLSSDPLRIRSLRPVETESRHGSSPIYHGGVAGRLQETPDQPFARFSVSDHGPGLTLSQQAHIWERFYRVPDIQVKSGSGVGLGLGLYISKIIIERHSGQVGVHSIPGQGSTFWFILPLAQ